MKIFSKKAIPVALLIVAVLAFGTLAYGAQERTRGAGPVSEEEKDSLIQDLADIDSNGARTAGVYMQGKRISIEQVEFAKIQERYALAGSTKAAQEAEEYLLWRESLCLLAEDAGLSVEAAAVDAYIAEQMEIFSGASNAADFQLYLDSLGMTMAEYFAGERENIRKNLQITAYREMVAMEIGDPLAEPVAQAELIQAELQRKSEAFVKKDKVKIVKQ